MSRERTASFDRLGDFEVLRELGCGGMGIVYEARQVSLNRKVAWKVLSGGLGLTGQAVTRFSREAAAADDQGSTESRPTAEQTDEFAATVVDAGRSQITNQKSKIAIQR